ncbi:unnamed protein product, partial [Symbiodinium sp. KB8]
MHAAHGASQRPPARSSHCLPPFLPQLHQGPILSGSLRAESFSAHGSTSVSFSVDPSQTSSAGLAASAGSDRAERGGAAGRGGARQPGIPCLFHSFWDWPAVCVVVCLVCLHIICIAQLFLCPEGGCGHGGSGSIEAVHMLWVVIAAPVAALYTMLLGGLILNSKHSSTLTSHGRRVTESTLWAHLQHTLLILWISCTVLFPTLILGSFRFALSTELGLALLGAISSASLDFGLRSVVMQVAPLNFSQLWSFLLLGGSAFIVITVPIMYASIFLPWICPGWTCSFCWRNGREMEAAIRTSAEYSYASLVPGAWFKSPTPRVEVRKDLSAHSSKFYVVFLGTVGVPAVLLVIACALIVEDAACMWGESLPASLTPGWHPNAVRTLRQCEDGSFLGTSKPGPAFELRSKGGLEHVLILGTCTLAVFMNVLILIVRISTAALVSSKRRAGLAMDAAFLGLVAPAILFATVMATPQCNHSQTGLPGPHDWYRSPVPLPAVRARLAAQGGRFQLLLTLAIALAAASTAACVALDFSVLICERNAEGGLSGPHPAFQREVRDSWAECRVEGTTGVHVRDWHTTLMLLVSTVFMALNIMTSFVRLSAIAAEQTRRARDLAARSEAMLRWLSHECRSPINVAILSMGNLLEEDVEDLLVAASGAPSAAAAMHRNARVAQAYAAVQSTAQKVNQPLTMLSGILDNMLMFLKTTNAKRRSRVGEGSAPTHSYNATTAVAHVCDMAPQLAESLDHGVPRLEQRVSSELAALVGWGGGRVGDFPPLHVETLVGFTTLKQAVLNLMSNAVKYGGSEGSQAEDGHAVVVGLGVRPAAGHAHLPNPRSPPQTRGPSASFSSTAPPASARTSARVEEGTVFDLLVHVTDFGRGMSADEIASLFKPFSRLR